MTDIYCVMLRDPAPVGLIDSLERRFGDVRVPGGRCPIHVERQLKGEAALRGLLTAVLDADQRVRPLLDVGMHPAGAER